MTKEGSLNTPLLMLVDGHALIHRAYHALPPLTVTKTGEPVSAVYGFASMLLKALVDLKPTHVAIAFDRAAPTFRHLQFEAYKAQRQRAPGELTSQFDRVRQLVEALGIPVYEVDGYEADDALGTLCRQANEEGIDCIIVTGDTDALQLVSPHTRVLAPRRSLGDTVLYDETAVRQRYGLEPPQIADLKGLEGDVSDNIPGVAGIGQKTATRLVQQFGNVEGIYQHIDEITPPKLQELLRHHEFIARQSKDLATIHTDVPITLDLMACQNKGYQRHRAVELFRELEFTSLLSKLPEQLVLSFEPRPRLSITTPNGVYHLVNTSEGLAELIQQLLKRTFVLDLETNQLLARGAKLVGIAFCSQPGEAYYIPVGHTTLDSDQLPLPQVLAQIKPLLEDPRVPKVAHNGKYDMTVLAEYGIEVANVAFDTMIAAYLLGEKALGLKALAFGKLGIEMTPITNLIGTGSKQITMAQVSPTVVADYAGADADMTMRLYHHLQAELKEQRLEKLFAEVEMPLLPVLFHMEQNGVALDIPFLRSMSQELGKKIEYLEGQIYDAVGHVFNINSSQQLGHVLFEELRMPRARRTKSGYSTDAAVLEGLQDAHPVVKLLLDYRQLMKLKSTYIDALPALANPETGRVHTTFNQTGTVTGRLSSSDPNLQNIPVRTELGLQVRQSFIAPDSHLLLAADYSQIDLRVLAHLSQDPTLLAAFAHDEDIHRATAAQVFGVAMEGVAPEMRRVAKTVNFGVIYGISDYGLAQGADLSREEAGKFISAYFQKYGKVKEYLEATKAQARQQGYVETILGRRRYIPEINSANAQARMAAERMAINMPVQGTSADIIKVAMIRIQSQIDEKGLRSKMILQVHDELIFKVPLEEIDVLRQLVEEIMPQALALSVPLKVEIKMGKRWGEIE
ncbi:MAG: DNA polymerase I [Chloroflexi bacterium]|nr:DNA polymerase I [Chloroflexota bacterium]